MQVAISQNAAVVRYPAKWVPTPRLESTAPASLAAAKLERLLEALEAPAIDVEARARLLKYMERHGKEHVTLLVRTIIESEGNANALVEPIISAVSSLMVFHKAWPSRGLFWIEQFDRLPLKALLQTMLSLDLFEPTTISRYLFMVLRNKLWDVFESPPIVKVPRKYRQKG